MFQQLSHPGRNARFFLAVAFAAVAVFLAVTLQAQGDARAEGPAAADCGAGPNRLCTEKLGSGYSNTALKVFWTINVTNPTGQAAAATITDCPDNFHTCATAPFATLESITGGTCGAGDLQSGLDCNIPANTTLAVKVSTPLVSAVRCNEVEVANAANVLQTSPTIIAPKSSPGASQTIPANGTGSDCQANTAPAIHVTKSPSTTNLPAGGGSVTYTYTVTNPGNVPLSNVTLSDDKCSPVSFVSGDTGSDGVLGTTETWMFSCTTTLTATTTNTATATGHFNDQSVSDTATATVVVATSEEVQQTLTVRKVLAPASDPGLFDLLIDGTAAASAVGNNGSGMRVVGAGEHTVAESGAAGTSLANYSTTYSANCAGGVVNVAAGADVTCTITNTRKTTVSPTPTTSIPLQVQTPTANPTDPPSPTPTRSATPTTRPSTPTPTVDIVLGARTPGPVETPAPPSTGSGNTIGSWFHSEGALTVMAVFLLSAILSGLVVTTSGKRR